MLLWRAVFVHVGSAYRRTMIGGLFGVVKGGFSRVRISPRHSRIPTPVIPAYPLPSFPRRRESSASWRLTMSRGRG